MPASATTSTIYAPNGMVCSVDHLASSAGVAMLRAGGSAADAAVATSAVLAVTTQHACGMGGDLLAVVHPGRNETPVALVSAGHAGSGADPAAMRAEGLDRIPLKDDIRAVTVPGCVDGWLALHDRYGRLPLADVLAPARSLAAEGFPASPFVVLTFPRIAHVAGADDYAAAEPLARGTLIRRPGVAAALDAIVEKGRAGFYGGAFGEGLVAMSDGLFAPTDLDTPIGVWTDALTTSAWGHDIWTVPPPSQGYLTLASAAIASELSLPGDPDDGAWPHLLAEAARWAAYDRPDVLHEGADGKALLAPERLTARAAQIDPDHRTSPHGLAAGGGTIYLCAVDGDRIGVSLTQSNADGWGAHIVEPNTRIFLHDRGIGFNLVPGHAAELGPGRRPPHTLSPALVTTADGRLRTLLGTMGGDSQPQVVLQLLARTLVAGETPGTAISAPRWRIGSGRFRVWDGDEGHVEIEARSPASWAEGLTARGHDVARAPAEDRFGHAHMIEVEPGGVVRGASDPRALGSAAAGC